MRYNKSVNNQACSEFILKDLKYSFAQSIMVKIKTSEINTPFFHKKTFKKLGCKESLSVPWWTNFYVE